MENNITISGIKETKDENCLMVAQDFFRSNMRITEEVPIAEATELELVLIDQCWLVYHIEGRRGFER